MAIINFNSISGINTVSVASSIIIGDNFVLDTKGIEGVQQLNVTGVVTASSFVGDGSTLTGIDATALKDTDGNVIVQAEASGINVTGVSTFISGGNGEIKIYEALGNPIIEKTGGGSLNIRANNNTDITVGSNYSGRFGAGGGVSLYHSGIQKFGTTTDGINIIGTTETDQLNVTGVSTFVGNVDLNGDLDVDGHTELDNVNIAGVLTATSAEFSGNVTVLGDLTYENVTNVDSVGIATARAGLRVTGGGLEVTGVSTFSSDISIADKIIHTGDTDTSIRFPAADTFTVETAGSERLRIKSDGKLGLNYNNPNTIIHAVGNNTVGTSVTCKLQSHDTPNATANLELLARDSSNNNETCRIRAASEGTANVDLQFHTNNTEKLRITSTGNVGINSTSPAYLLDIASSSASMRLNSTATSTLVITSGASNAARIEFGDLANNDTGYIYYDNSNDSMQFATNGSNERLRIGSSGQIGLGGANYGSSGQVLTSQGSSAAPQWSSPATPNNGTLTINQGGSSKGTFTANQSSNTTVNLDAGNPTGLGMDKYVIFNDSGTILSSSNISSVSRTNNGRYTINFSGSFSNTNYLILSTGRNYSTDENERSLTIYSMSTGSCNVALVANNNGGPDQNGGHVAFYGT